MPSGREGLPSLILILVPQNLGVFAPSVDALIPFRFLLIGFSSVGDVWIPVPPRRVKS